MTVYPYTNENVQSYNRIYNFRDARVLSVVGSGDQYFTSILNGAKEVDLFDKNKYALYYFVLKFIALRRLSYEEFWDLMIINANILEENKILFEKLKLFLPKKVKTFFKKMFFHDEIPMGDLFSVDYEYHLNLFYSKHYNSGEFIPYFDKSEYYRLQNLLKNRELPNMYQQNFLTLNPEIKNQNYDLILASNIMSWVYGNCPSEYDMQNYFDIVNELNFREMQANYIWGLDEQTLETSRPIYKDYGFIPSFVPSTNEYKKYDCVLSLRRVK